MIDRISKVDFRSNNKLLMMGKVEGPGGSLWLEFLVLKLRRLKKALMRAETEREHSMMNQVSIFEMSNER